jgi:DNA-binding PadR family transcriptional regulator
MRWWPASLRHSPRRMARLDRLTTTENAILGMLSRYGEHSGYELLKCAESGIGFIWSPAKSHVYDVLPRLERGGRARRRVIHQRGKPDKHLWRITRRGHAALREWVNTIDEDSLSNRGAFLLKLFFGDSGDPECLLAHVERYHRLAAEKLAALQAIDAETDWTAPEELPRITLRQGLAGTEAQLRWAEETLPQLRARVSSARVAAHGGAAPGDEVAGPQR